MNYYRIFHHNKQDEYCTHYNIKVSLNNDIKKIIKEHFSKNDVYIEITEDDYNRDSFYKYRIEF